MIEQSLRAACRRPRLSLAALRTTLAAASQWAFAQSIFLTTANWSQQEKFLGLIKQQESFWSAR